MKQFKLEINQDHHECKDDETWLTNVPKYKPKQFINLNWKTKRKGHFAYNEDGESIPSYQPVFIKISELKDKQKKSPAQTMIEETLKQL